MSWPRVPLGELLIERRERVGTSDASGLPLLGVSNAEGLHRSVKERIADMSRYFHVRRDWFAYNPMRINVGSIGWAETEQQTGVISPDYVVFSCGERILSSLLYRFLRSRVGLEAIYFGTAGSVRERLYFESLARISFPLPPLAEQQRIVARVDAIAARLAEARRLREEAVEDAQRLCRAIIRGTTTLTPMNELVQQREEDVQVEQEQEYHFAGVYCFGRGVFQGQRKKGLEFSYDRLTRLQTGNFVYPKLMAWEGALAVVPENCNGLVVSTEFPVFEINTERVLPEVLDVYFRDPAVWPRLSGKSTGTNVRRQRLNPTDFLSYQFPLPPRSVQERLRGVVAALNILAPVQAETATELDALLPSVLNRAFAGKL